MDLLNENGIEPEFAADGTMSVSVTKKAVDAEEEEEEEEEEAEEAEAPILDYFDWKIPGAEAMLAKWKKDRFVQSPDFRCNDLEEMQAEFFPNGLGEGLTWPGWCALRLRVPDRTLLEWRVHIGPQREEP